MARGIITWLQPEATTAGSRRVTPNATEVGALDITMLIIALDACCEVQVVPERWMPKTRVPPPGHGRGAREFSIYRFWTEFWSSVYP